MLTLLEIWIPLAMFRSDWQQNCIGIHFIWTKGLDQPLILWPFNWNIHSNSLDSIPLKNKMEKRLHQITQWTRLRAKYIKTSWPKERYILTLCLMKMSWKKLQFRQSVLAGWCPRYSETWVVYEVLYVAKSFPIWKLVWRVQVPRLKWKHPPSVQY